MNNKSNNLVTRMTIDSKSLLARLIATENIVVEHDHRSDTAYFDTGSRRLVLPVWDNMDGDTYDMLVGHEVGHALFTPTGAEPLMQAIDSIDPNNRDVVKGFLNVVEDARIERLIKRKYPGFSHNFRRAYTRMFEQDQFGFKSRVTKPQDLSLIDRLNLRAKIGVHADIDIPLENHEQMVFAEMMRTESWDEVVDLTRRIYQMHKQPPKTNSHQNKHTVAAPNTPNDSVMGDTPNMGAGDDQQVDAPTEQGDQASQSDAPAAPVTDQAVSNASQKSQKPEDDQFISYIDLPVSIDLQSIVNPYKTFIDDFSKVDQKHNYATFKEESKRYISMLSKEFELRKAADVHSRTSIAKTGAIDPDRLHQHKFVEDIFRRNSVIREGKNHGMVMFIDWSSSMTGVIGPTIRQTMLLAMFCRSVNIPFEVFAFSDVANPSISRDDGLDKSRGKELRFGSFQLHQFLSNRMKSSEFHRAMEILLAMSNIPYLLNNKYALNSTPLYNTVASARYIVDDFRKRNNLQVVNTVILTDGDDSNGLHTYSGNGVQSGYGRGVVRDRATGAQVALDDSDGYRGRLGKMIALLKNTTQSNVVGFYLVHSSHGKSQIASLAGCRGNDDKTDAIMADFRNNKFVEINNPQFGYDAFFVIPSDKLNVELDEKHDYLNKTLTKGRIATAFLKTAQAKAVNRVLIRRFITFISK